jgi:uncharacterized RDD family membrane protein YckC
MDPLADSCSDLPAAGDLECHGIVPPDPVCGDEICNAVQLPGGADAAPPVDLDAANNSIAPPPVRPFPAGFMERAGAAVLDAGMQALLCLLVTILTGVTTALIGLRQRLALDSVFGPGVLLVTLLLYSLTEVFGTATPGKLFPQLSIARPDGRPAPMALRLRRWAIRNAHLLLLTGCYALWAFQLLAMTGTAPGGQLVRAARALLGGASLLAGAAIALGTLMALSSGRRTLHDYLSGTAVYPARDVAAAAAEAERGFEPLVQNSAARSEG